MSNILKLLAVTEPDILLRSSRRPETEQKESEYLAYIGEAARNSTLNEC